MVRPHVEIGMAERRGISPSGPGHRGTFVAERRGKVTFAAAEPIWSRPKPKLRAFGMIKIFGHKAPDSDSTGSPLIWEWFSNEVRRKPAKAYLLGQPNKEALFMLDRWGFDLPETIADLEEGDEVIIVDTNNPAELPAGIGKARIVEIIDHHLLQGGLATREPISIFMKPVACTATIMHELMGDAAERMPAPVRGLMLTCILSDTIEFRSPTTTDHDRTLAEQLARDLGIDIAAYAAEMFAAKSDLADCPDDEVLRIDSKTYEIDGRKLKISVLETTSPSAILARKPGLIEAMDRVAEEDGVDQLLFFVVDILNESATLIAPNDFVRNLAEQSFSARAAGDEVHLPGIVSRKKQIIPNLSF